MMSLANGGVTGDIVTVELVITGSMQTPRGMAKAIEIPTDPETGISAEGTGAGAVRLKASFVKL